MDRETAYYLANIGKVKSIDEFVKDDRLFRYAMKAHGLEDHVLCQGLHQVKALTEGISDPNSFANKLTDKRYAEFVKTFNFAAIGRNGHRLHKAQHEAVSNYLNQVSMEGVEPPIQGGSGRDQLLPRQYLQGEIDRRVHGERPVVCLRHQGLRH